MLPPPIVGSATASTEPAVAPLGLTAETLTLAKERTYFGWVVVISLLVWVALAVSIIGLVYAALIGAFLWLGSGLLTAYLRAEAVQVGPEQIPALDATFRDVCARLGIRDVPRLYVLQSGGLLNAFATRFAGRDFVVVYSDFLEALGPDSREMRFVLGHEIGHLQSRHVLKQILLAPGLFFPLIGPAYRRAWESSCDRYGAYAARDVNAAVRAMLVISGGSEYGRQLNPTAFAHQHAGERGFFVSLHELTSTYPTLSRRVTELRALVDGREIERPRRHMLAWLLALFIPGGGAGAGSPAAGLLITVVMIGLLASMAIPAFQSVRQAAQAKVCINNSRMLAAALDQYRLEHDRGAETWEEIVGADKLIAQMPLCLLGGTYQAEYDANSGYSVTCSHPGHDQDTSTAGEP